MPQCRQLPPIDSSVQFQTITFDFGPLIARNYPAGTTLTGTPTVACKVARGTDADPSSRLQGSPVIGTAPAQGGGSGLSDCAVLQQIGNGVGGATYLLQCVCALSSGDTESLWTYLPCVTPQ